MTHRKPWSQLTAAEKIGWVESKKELAMYFDPQVRSAQQFFTEERKRKERIKKHTAAILKLRAS